MFLKFGYKETTYIFNIQILKIIFCNIMLLLNMTIFYVKCFILEI